MDGAELRRIRRRLKLTQVKFASILGVTSTTVARWERGERGISESIARLVKFSAASISKSSKGGK